MSDDQLPPMESKHVDAAKASSRKAGDPATARLLASIYSDMGMAPNGDYQPPTNEELRADGWLP